MTLEHKAFSLQVKSVDDEGRFSGYLSTFGNVDELGDLDRRAS
jgi:hypothetical protein